MTELVWIILLFFVVIVIGTVLFGGWVVFKITSAIFRSFTGQQGPPMQLTTPNMVRCPRGLCQADSPVGSRFCRRCGARLPDNRSIAMNRAAMW